VSRFEFNFDTDRNIDLARLDDELVKLPSLVFHYGELKAEADFEYDTLKAKHEEVRSEEYVKLKSSGEKITEAHIKALIDVSISVLNIKSKMLDAKRNSDTLKNYMESLRHKSSMLVQLSANKRKDLE